MSVYHCCVQVGCPWSDLAVAAVGGVDLLEQPTREGWGCGWRDKTKDKDRYTGGGAWESATGGGVGGGGGVAKTQLEGRGRLATTSAKCSVCWCYIFIPGGVDVSCYACVSRKEEPRRWEEVRQTCQTEEFVVPQHD